MPCQDIIKCFENCDQTDIKQQKKLQFSPMQKQQKIEDYDMNTNKIYCHFFPFRAVLPYKHKYQTFAKSRWYGKELLETLVRQFKAYDRQYYKKAVEEGRITINGNHVSIDYKIKNGDKLVHSAIRQQPPILDLDIQIIESNDDYLVVNKPPSFTVHTGGGFHYNTLSSILQIEKGYKDLYVLHRLDRLTSGLIIYGKSKQKPLIFHKQNQSQQIKKMYYARVTGKFPWAQKTLYAQIQCVSHKDGIYKVTRQLVQNQQFKQQDFDQNQIQECKQFKAQELKQIKAHKNSKVEKQSKRKDLNPDLKDSKTHFKKVFYDEKSDSSLIECYPISGRTHQIRVHLQFLGFPILNDTVYGGKFVGNNIIKQISRKKQKNHHKKKINTMSQGIMNEGKMGSKKIKLSNQDRKEEEQNEDKIKKSEGLTKEVERIEEGNLQAEERQKLKKKLQLEWDIKKKPWQICLHSFQYRLQGRVYQTPKPYWAQQSFQFQLN